MATKKKAAKKKAARKPTPAPVPKPKIPGEKRKLSDPRPWMLENKYAIGNKGGRPPIYETPEELQAEVDRYFEWINGIFEEVENSIELTNPKTKEVTKQTIKTIIWHRRPEPPTITGLTLYLGFLSRGAMHDQKNRSEEFSNVTARAIDRVVHSYEVDLRDKDKTRGSQFALPNIGSREGWRNTQNVQNLGADGKPTDPPKGVTVNVSDLAPNIKKNI